MVEYNKLEDENISLIHSEVSSFVDKNFQGMHNLLDSLEEQGVSITGRVRSLFELNEVSDALKYLLRYKKGELYVDGDRINSKENESAENLSNILKLFNEEELKCLYDIFRQYGEKIKEQSLDSVKEQSPVSVSVFEKIKLFFQNIIAKLKGESIEDFDDKHTTKIGDSKFYCDTVTQAEPKQEINESEWEVVDHKKVLKQKVSKSPTLVAIVEEDGYQSVGFDLVGDSQDDHIYENIASLQEETLPKPQVARIEEKPAVPSKSQKVIDAGNKIREGRSQKAETPTYTSCLTINLRSPCEKPKIGPKPTIETNFETKQYGQNVRKLVEKFEAKGQEAVVGRSM